MIPGDRDELHALAGEYVLGLVDAEQRQEIEAARGTNAALDQAIAFWEERLHPLSALAPPAEPPPGTWERIALRLRGAGATSRAAGKVVRWRWATAAAGALAAGLALYIAVAPRPPMPRLVAVLHAPQQDQPAWVATTAAARLHLQAVAGQTPPADRAFELWVIPPGATAPQPLGVVPTDGRLELAAVPAGIGAGATLAISLEPPGGSPTGQPTGPVVFVGTLVQAD
ncbi:MAG TPA: anti-sigma factor [Stellaceae bacterium]|nr:anti-sigma factor [Stellaceae bacterium]